MEPGPAVGVSHRVDYSGRTTKARWTKAVHAFQLQRYCQGFKSLWSTGDLLCGLYVNFDDLVTVVDFGRSINILQHYESVHYFFRKQTESVKYLDEQLNNFELSVFILIGLTFLLVNGLGPQIARTEILLLLQNSPHESTGQQTIFGPISWASKLVLSALIWESKWVQPNVKWDNGPQMAKLNLPWLRNISLQVRTTRANHK